jgi:hypothetical protein
MEAKRIRALEQPLHTEEISHLWISFDHLHAASLESQIVKELPFLFLPCVWRHDYLLPALSYQPII